MRRQYEAIVPTVADRVAQTVVAIYLGERAEPIFHPDSYGYRPAKSALDAVATCRQRCWKYDWAVDLDVQKFFDTVPWDLVLKAVRAVTDCAWVLLYVERWLAAPLQLPDGTLVERTRGTPQGSLCAAPHKPPWGVPVFVPTISPSSERMPDLRNAFTKSRTRLSPTLARRRSMRPTCEISSNDCSTYYPHRGPNGRTGRT